MGHDEGWFLNLLDDRGYGERFAGAGCAEQDLVLESALDAFNKQTDGFRLVAGGLEGGGKFEGHEDRRRLIYGVSKNGRSIFYPKEGKKKMEDQEEKGT